MKSVGQTLQGQSKIYPASVLNDPGTSNANGLPILLDSGSTISFLPAAAVRAIAADYPGATLVDATALAYSIPCNAPIGSIDYTFGTKTIRVPFSELVRKLPSGTCRLGIQYGDGDWILGDTFLRAAYAVYDIDNKSIWLDQADDCGSSIVAIGSGTNAVPAINGCNCAASPSNVSSVPPSNTAKPGVTTPLGMSTETAAKQTATRATQIIPKPGATTLVAPPPNTPTATAGVGSTSLTGLQSHTATVSQATASPSPALFTGDAMALTSSSTLMMSLVLVVMALALQ